MREFYVFRIIEKSKMMEMPIPTINNTLKKIKGRLVTYEEIETSASFPIFVHKSQALSKSWCFTDTYSGALIGELRNLNLKEAIERFVESPLLSLYYKYVILKDVHESWLNDYEKGRKRYLKLLRESEKTNADE